MMDSWEITPILSKNFSGQQGSWQTGRCLQIGGCQSDTRTPTALPISSAKALIKRGESFRSGIISNWGMTALTASGVNQESIFPEAAPPVCPTGQEALSGC